MAHCERLSSSAYDEIENKLGKITDSKETMFGMVFLYAEEASNARIRSCLGNYLVKSAEVTDTEKLREYVTSKILAEVSQHEDEIASDSR